MSLTIHSDAHYMNEAMKQALLARDAREIPVGAVVVADNRIIARAHNQTEQLNDPTAHAEMLALTAAANYLGAKYLVDCTLYVTLEPCGMCAGALYWAQLGKLVYAASDEKRGYTAINSQLLHPKTKVMRGPLAEKSAELVRTFFKEMRR